MNTLVVLDNNEFADNSLKPKRRLDKGLRSWGRYAETQVLNVLKGACLALVVELVVQGALDVSVHDEGWPSMLRCKQLVSNRWGCLGSLRRV